MTASAPAPGARADFRQGLRDALPVALGYVPLGVSYGMFAVSVGLPWWMVAITALVIYAGSMEFLAAGMLVGAAPLGQSATTTLFVNSRHVFYGLSVPLERVRNPFARFYCIHALTDEVYAVCSGLERDLLTGPRILAISASSQAYWVVGSTVGALFASVLPFDLSFMSFAMTALFAILAINAAKASREWLLFGAAIAIGVLAMIFAKEAMLLVALLVYFALAVGMVAVRRRRAA
ncbi:AzlC family ABC transporter permease [Gulosibacter sp. 10]|uniref:AzlC family ABC transporter permease n=1 Tax=Gulosibacter sp. 10 TaxID=1255570 RepID=UPI00097E9222|nr:AzlC family ABC transporter permease [Gulosibacter sp. 10]SJM68191.1 putative branched-chain amino acid transporter [Gulosibacter sp. 10]